jgi:LuxR family transcriptional regulator, maltose regulon positive regulatory protein
LTLPERSPPIAKITRPRIRGVFLRERLFRLLDETRTYPVTWISAPAGSGKTTLVASYLEANKIPCLWYQVDEGDADIATFFNYLGLAAKNAAPQKRKPLPLLSPEYFHGISTFTLRYFENLFGRLKPPFILILDNYQTVPAESDFHEVINNGLSAIPDGIQGIIISRHDLPPALARLQANGLMKILGWDDLRLTLEETMGIVPLKARKIPSAEVIGQLHQATDGWVAGLVLMLESMERGVEPLLLGKMAPEEIIDYFGNEFFNKTDKEIQSFLLKTAFLPKITLTAAEQLSGLSNAGSILLALSRNNNFTERHYSSEPVYQFHALYREFLMTRARETFSQQELSTLLHQTASLLEQGGQLEAAIFLLHDLNEWGEMVRLIMQLAPSMIEQGRYRPLADWLNSLPGQMIEDNPWLLYWKGTSLFPFDPFQAQPYLEQAFEQFRIRDDLIGSLLAWSGVVESIFFIVHDFLRLDQWIQKFPKLPDFPEKIIPSEVWGLVVSSMFSALTNRHPDHPEIEEWTKRAASIVQRPANPIVKGNLLFHLVHWYLVIGDYEKSSSVVRSFQHLARSETSLPFILILAKFSEAMNCQLNGEHQKCLTAVSEGLKISENSGIFSLYCSLLGHAISSCQNMGDLETAETLLEKMASSSDNPTPVDRGHHLFCQTRQSLLRSELVSACTQSELALKANMEFGLFSAMGVTLLLTAQVMHRIGKQKEAWKHLDEAFRYAKRAGSKIWEYSGLMIEAHFYFEQGNEASGLTSLRKALAIGKERGYLNTYIDQPAVTARLCIKALEEEIETPYVQEIIRKRQLIPENAPLHLENWPWPLKITTLGRFELLRDGNPIPFSRKVQQKPLTLLKALIAFGGREIREEQISDILWPEADGDAAHRSFITTLHRLRHLLGYEKAIRYREGRVTLDERYCWLDIWAFEHFLGQVEAKRKEGQPERAIQLTGKVIHIFKGSFLAGEPDKPWAISMQERLKSKFIRTLNQSAHYWSTTGQWGSALDYYQKALEVDDNIEELYQNLMSCHQRLGQKAEAIAVYNRCRKTLSAALGIEPSSKTQTIYRSLLSE